MTKQEFELLTGEMTTDINFEFAHRVYMAAGDMDKDTFCEDWKENNLTHSKIVSTLTLEVETLNAALKTANNCYESAENALRDFNRQMADYLIIQAEKWSASDLREKAIELVGWKEYLRRKLAMKFELWEADRQLVLKLINE